MRNVNLHLSNTNVSALGNVAYLDVSHSKVTDISALRNNGILVVNESFAGKIKTSGCVYYVE